MLLMNSVGDSERAECIAFDEELAGCFRSEWGDAEAGGGGAMEKERSAEGRGVEGGVAPHCELATKGGAQDGYVAEDERGKLVS